jgi:hypothetical protein
LRWNTAKNCTRPWNNNLIFLIAFTCEWFAEIKGSVIIWQFETINERPSTSIMSTEWGKNRLQRKRERTMKI